MHGDTSEQWTRIWSKKRERDDRFNKGDSVEHKVFGKGQILSVDTKNGSYCILFEKMNTSRAISMRVALKKI